MYESHFGLRESPFVAAHQARYIYPSPEHQEALAHLRFGIENSEPFVLITGEVGTGKTTALYDALCEWKGRAVIGLITNSSLTRAELLEEIALRLGVEVSPGSSKPQIMVKLEHHLLDVRAREYRAILLLDEAQNLGEGLLEEIRLLSNLEASGVKLLQIFLVGQPELEARLGRPELRQIRQRIAVHYRLKPLDYDDTERYIHHRVAVAGGHGLTVFPPATCREVHRLTHGIPREINHLCSQAMVSAFVDGATSVGVPHIRAAAEELEFRSVADAAGPTAAPSHATEKSWEPETLDPEAGQASTQVSGVGEVKPGAASTTERTTSEAQAHKAGTTESRTHEARGDNAPAWAPEELTPESPIGDKSFAAVRHAAPDAEPAAGTPDKHAEDSGSEEREQTAPATSSDEAFERATASMNWEPWFKSLTASAQEELRASAAAQAARAEHGSVAGTSKQATSEPEQPRVAVPTTPEHPAGSEHATSFESPKEIKPTKLAPFAEALRRAKEAQEAQEALARMSRPEGRAADAPVPVVAATAPRTEATLESLPPRLRAKIASDGDEMLTSSNNAPLKIMAALAIVAVVLVGAVLAERFWLAPAREQARATPTANAGTQNTGAETHPAADDASSGSNSAETMGGAETNAAANPVSNEASGGSGEAGGAQPSAGDDTKENNPAAVAAGSGAQDAAATTDAAATKPAASASTATPKPTANADVASAKPAPPAETFSLAVGTYLNEDRARVEQTKLAKITRFKASVMTVQEDNVAMFRVVLGSFSSRTAAENAASDLIAKGLVDEARIMPGAGSR